MSFPEEYHENLLSLLLSPLKIIITSIFFRQLFNRILLAFIVIFQQIVSAVRKLIYMMNFVLFFILAQFFFNFIHRVRTRSWKNRQSQYICPICIASSNF